MTAASLTVLRAHDGRQLAKQFELANAGSVVCRAYDKGTTWFSAQAVQLTGLRSLHRLLLRLEAESGACIIRGAPAAATDRKRTRRNKRAFPETPRHWLMLDVDGIPLPPGCSVLAAPADAARAVLDILTAHLPELEDVAAVVQFSASAALNEIEEGEALAGTGRAGRWRGVVKPGISAHVWFWLRTPRGEAELKRWLAPAKAAGLKLTDTILTVQPHYTAGPIFGDGLRDPLAGRRTLLIEGGEDAAELVIPAEPERPRYAPGEGTGTAGAGRGYAAFLDGIGGRDGFRGPIKSAIASFVATNWPAPDLAALKADIRARIATADPGGRPAAVLEEYAADRHLDSIIAWAVEQEAGKRTQQQAEAARPVAPTFPDRGIPLAAAERQAAAVVSNFAKRLRQGEAPEVLLQLTVGGGKSEAAIVGTEDLIAAARAGGRDGALFYLVPRHELGGEIVARIGKAHHGRRVAVWYGMDQPDPLMPSKAMCRDPELPRLAAAAGLSATAACSSCPLRLECGYRRQRGQEAEVWILAHNSAFHRLPAALPKAAALVIDEAFWPAGLAGTDGPPVQLAVSALTDERTGRITGLNRARLLDLRRLMAAALEGMGEGGIHRAPFDALGITAASAEEWRGLEWMTAPAPGLDKGMDRDTIAERLREAAGSGFSKLRPLLAKFVAALLAGSDVRSVNARIVRDVDLGRNQGSGDVIRFAWRQDFAEWAAEAPKLVLDATTRPEVIRQWLPRLEVQDIEVQAPLQRVRQVADREFGRTFFIGNPRNVQRLADMVTVELSQTDGEVLVVAQAAVEDELAQVLRSRVADDRLPDGGDGLPARLRLAHHGNLTGLDCYRDAPRVLVAGRPAMNRRDGERLAEVMQGRGVEVVAEEDARWPTVEGGIRLADGSGAAVRQPRHPDALVEAVRWSITEGAILQAIGRARGVRRAVEVTFLGQLALPLTVAEVVTWDEAVPDRREVAVAEAAMAGRALPLAAADMAKARPDLWTVTAAEYDLKQARKGGKTLIGDTYKGFTPLIGLLPARYRKAGDGGSLALALVPLTNGRAALEAIVGRLSAFELVHPAPERQLPLMAVVEAKPPPPEPRAAMPPPPSPAARLADLSRRLEAARPPPLAGDATDLAQLLAWRQRCRDRHGQVAA